MLRTLILALYNDTCRQMRNTDRRGRLIDVLTARTAGTVRIDTQIIHVDLYIEILLNIRHNLAAYEGSLTLSRRIERRNTHEAVYALL